MIKVVIIDDELSGREILTSLVKEHFPQLDIVGEADSVKSGYECIIKHNPDLVFLDINLRDGTGFNLIQKFTTIDFKIIFVTAYNEYAIKAIKYNAIDYILKPIDLEEFTSGVQKAIDSFSGEDGEVATTSAEPNKEALYVSAKNTEKKIVLKTSESIYLVDIKNILRCSSESSYTTFFLYTGEKIMVSKTLREFEEVLVKYGFLRVHQSHLVNLSYVVRFDKRDGGSVILEDKTKVPVSHRRKQKLLDYFDGL
ncbi:response regulator transcription factor [Prolixibacteraceae bacterium JC049]|nr:response regulator transcription factor [Prolixibacteraceae bacterium JC049]